MTDTQFRYLKHFLEAYWHELADEFYSGVEGAGADFNAESVEYRVGLVDDLKRGQREGLFADDYSDAAYDRPFWKQFSRLLSADDAERLRIFLLKTGPA
jgi:hypothetical protein